MKVQVYCYDLTRGMTAALSPMLLGYQIEAVWHTGVVIDGREEVFFGYGISKGRAGATMFGQPARVLDMGESEVTGDVLEELLSDLAPRFRPQDYNLLFHNCNTFSNELVQLLTGEALPDYIMSQAEHLFNTPWGESLMPMIMAMEGFTGSATANGMATQQQQHTAAQPAASSPPAAAASQAASSSAAAVQVGVQAAEAAAASVARAEGGDGGAQAGSGVEPPTAAEATAASAAANAGMAAMARASQQQQQQEGQEVVTAGGSAPGPSGGDAAAAAAGKAAEGVAGLSLTADSRAPQEQQQ